MMDVCQKAQTEIRGSKEMSDISIISPFKNRGLKSPIKLNGCNKITGTKIEFFREFITLKAEENFGKKILLRLKWIYI